MTYEWLAPFLFNNWSGLTWYHHNGQGVYLTGGDGRLVAQAWPYSLDFDLQGLRLLRRYPPVEDPAAFGWTVQGNLVSRETGQAWGIEPGFVGFPLCLLAPLSASIEPFGGFRSCDAYLFPGHSAPISGVGGDTSVLLRRGLEPEEGTLDALAAVEPFRWEPGTASVSVPPMLSLDPVRRSLWRGTPQGTELLPVADGAIGPPALQVTFSFPPLDQGNAQLELLFYHPERERFFGTARIRELLLSEEAWFFELDRELGLLQSRDISPIWDGAPVTFASAGELPADHEQLVPLIARTPGRNGTDWTSDLWLFNPSGAPTAVQLRRLSRSGVERTVDLPPHGSRFVPDVLGCLGDGPDGDGSLHDALLVEASYRWGEQVVAVTRVHTAGEGGTYGQAVPAVPGEVGYSNHLQYPGEVFFDTYYHTWEDGLRAAILTPDRRDPVRFRHNLGIANTTTEPLRMTLVWGFSEPWEWEFYWGLPYPAGRTQTVEVGPRQVKLVSLEQLFPPSARDAWPARVAVFGERPAAVWLSMVDNLTGDGTFVPFTTYHWPAESQSDRVVLPVVAHSGGVAGTQWRTDLYGVQGNYVYGCSSGEYDNPQAWLYPTEPECDCDGAALAGEITTELQGEPGFPIQEWVDELTGGGEPPTEEEAAYCWHTVFPDVTHLFPQCAEDGEVRGALEISAGGWMGGYSRTYSVRADGGTYGEMLPFFPSGGWPVQHFAGVEIGADLRVNVGLFNGDHDHAMTHRLTLYTADGRLAAERTLTLRPLRGVQRRLEHLFGLEVGDLAAGTYGLTVLPLADPEHGVEGRSWAYVSMVDSATGDPTNWW